MLKASGRGRFDWPIAPGVRAVPLGADRPPDGWEVVGGGLSASARRGFDIVVLRTADAAARRITRRRFLERSARVAVLIGAGLNGILGFGRDVAAAGTARACYSCSDPCGPSPPCSSSYCSSTGQCAGSNVKRRVHDTFQCGTSSTANCWLENCCACSPPKGFWNCCDCCAPAGGISCSGCSTKKACICQKKTGQTCT